MRFAPTDDQLALRDAVASLLARECPPEVVRAAWPEGPESSGAEPGHGPRAEVAALDAVWKALAEMGVSALALPEDKGGLGLGPVEWALVAEELGYAAFPLPLTDTMAVAVPLLAGADGGHDDLAGLADGSLRLTASFDDGPVPFAHGPIRADRLLWRDGSALVLSSQWTPEVGASSTDRARWAAPVSGQDEVARFAQPLAVASAFDRGVLGAAAELVGLSRRMLDLTLAYVSARRQFGVPVGSFQAVKHRLVDARLRIEFAIPAVRRAAWTTAAGLPTAGRDVSMAKALASDAAMFTSRVALQGHGAIGYTVEYDLHLWLKRAWALVRAWGGPAWHNRRVGTALGLREIAIR